MQFDVKIYNYINIIYVYNYINIKYTCIQNYINDPLLTFNTIANINIMMNTVLYY